MSRLHRDCDTYNPAVATNRTTAPDQLKIAKDQAYILRDLIKQHCKVDVSGGDVTDVLALTFHGCDWARVVAETRGVGGETYFARQRSQVLKDQSKYLAGLIKTQPYLAARAILDMPLPAYNEARTLAGARLATLISGQPTWILPAKTAVLFDSSDDSEIQVISFTSNPTTNEENLRVQDLSGRQRTIPLSNIRYTKMDRGDGYYLRGHSGTEKRCNTFQSTALNYKNAEVWFNAGNDIRVYCLSGNGGEITRLSIWSDSGKKSFLESIAALRTFHDECNVIMTPLGLATLRDPIERFNASFKYTKQLLPAVLRADEIYSAALDQLASQGSQAYSGLQDATERYNETLIQALECYYRDTVGANSRDGLSSYLPKDVREDLCFSSSNPFLTLCTLIREDKGNVKSATDQEFHELIKNAQLTCPIPR